MPSDVVGCAAREASNSIVKHCYDSSHYASFIASEGFDADSYHGDGICMQRSDRTPSILENGFKSAPYFDTMMGRPMPDLK